MRMSLLKEASDKKFTLDGNKFQTFRPITCSVN